MTEEGGQGEREREDSRVVTVANASWSSSSRTAVLYQVKLLKVTLTIDPSVCLCYGCCGDSWERYTREYVAHNDSRCDGPKNGWWMRYRMSFKAEKSVLETGLSNVFGGKDGSGWLVDGWGMRTNSATALCHSRSTLTTKFGSYPVFSSLPSAS